ncbi:MAG: toll/interleukin-1 receptor domain-containing protein [Candidatus Magnetobacterium sp. LHC-1]
MKIFISYASEDRKFALSLAKKLKKDFPDDGVWIDRWEIKVGDSIVEKINDGLEKSSFLIVVFSDNSRLSNWVQRELSSTLMRELNGEDVNILPILLEIEQDELPPGSTPFKRGHVAQA